MFSKYLSLCFYIISSGCSVFFRIFDNFETLVIFPLFSNGAIFENPFNLIQAVINGKYLESLLLFYALPFTWKETLLTDYYRSLPNQIASLYLRKYKIIENGMIEYCLI